MKDVIPVFFFYQGQVAQGVLMAGEAAASGIIPDFRITSAPSEDSKAIVHEAIRMGEPVLAQEIVTHVYWKWNGHTWRRTELKHE